MSDNKISKQMNNNPKYVIFNAEGKILGRLATEIAKVLSGKNKVDFMPNMGGSDWAIVINSDKIRLSGSKAKKKLYWKHSGYPGGIKSINFDDLLKKDSTKIIELAVKGMLPKNKLSREAMKRLRVFKNEKHNFGRQIKGQENKNINKEAK